MAESVLSRLVKTDKETKVNLDQINGTLDKMYKLQVKTAKDEVAYRKRTEQQAKKSGDRLGTLMGTNKAKEKKEKKGFLSKLADIFGGVLGGLTAAGLFKALETAALGGVIIGYFKSPAFRKFVNDFILKPLGGAILEILCKRCALETGIQTRDYRFLCKRCTLETGIQTGIVDFFVKDAPWKKSIRDGFTSLLETLKFSHQFFH